MKIYRIHRKDMPGIALLVLCMLYPMFLSAQTFLYKPITYLSGDNLDYAFHAWFEFEHPVTADFEYLNVRVTNPDSEASAWLIVNLPLVPDAMPRPVRYRMDVQEISDGVAAPPMVIAEISIGPFITEPEFPPTQMDSLPGIPENHFVPTGMPRLSHNFIPYFPPIPPLPPIIPDTIFGMNRGCDVPNIDLDSLMYPDPVSGDINSCGPAAAANSLKWLMDVHPEIPQVDSLRGIMDSLEALMHKTSEGVQWDSFIMAKLAFIDKHMLPIRVKYQVHTPNPEFKPIIPSPDSMYGHAAENETGPSGFPDFDWICSELDHGEDVEMIMTYWCDSMGVRVQRSSHVINIIGYVKVGEVPWLIWKHDIDQIGPGGTIEEYGRWCVDSEGYPFLKEMSESNPDCIAYVGSVVSESYDANVLFTDVSKYDWSYKRVVYLAGAPQHDYKLHVLLTYTLPSDTSFHVLNARLCNPTNGADLWLLQNVPLPDLSAPMPMRLKIDLNPLAAGDTLPGELIMKYHIGDVQTNADFPIHAYVDVRTPWPDPYVALVANGGFIGYHPLIPDLAPLVDTLILPLDIDFLLRGCDVPNIDLDSTMHPVDPMDPQSTDYAACGPAAAANSLQWLDDQHEEIDIPIEIRPILDSLKRMMALNPTGGGVRWDSLIIGKLDFIDRYHLPIHVKFQAHAGAPAEIPSPNPLYGHSATNESPENPNGPPPYLHPTYDWLCQELEAGEDVEMLYGYYCDTSIMIIDTILLDTLETGEIVMDTLYEIFEITTETLPDGTIVMDTSYLHPKKERKSGHVINITGKVMMGPLRWITYKHDVYQKGEGGTSPDNVPEGYAYTDMSEWVEDAAGYASLTRESYYEMDGDHCTAYVEEMISESYDPDIEFCVEKVCIPDDDGEGSLRAALACVMPGDTIFLGPEIADDTIRLTSGPLILDKNLVIYRTDQNPSWEFNIKGESVSRVFEIQSGVTVTMYGLNIICGEAADAGCVQNAGTVVFRDTQFYNHDGLPGTASQIINTGTMHVEGSTNLRID